MFAEAGPAAFLSNAYKAGQALVDQQTNYRHPYFSRFHQKARTDERGVTIHEPDRAQAGLTLYTSGHDQRAFLMSMNGDVLHEWDLPFSAIWDETSPVKQPLGDEYIYYRRAHLYPNGDLLVIYIASGDTPWGYGAARMTKDSEVVWSYLGQAHHDFDVGSDGKIYLLTHEISHEPIEAWTQLKPPRVDDFIVVLSPDGKELQKVGCHQSPGRQHLWPDADAHSLVLGTERRLSAHQFDRRDRGGGYQGLSVRQARRRPDLHARTDHWRHRRRRHGDGNIQLGHPGLLGRPARP